MNQERSDLITTILNEHNKQREQAGKISALTPAQYDHTSKEVIGYTVAFGLGRDSQTVKKLESLGFRVLYPAELSEEKINSMSLNEKNLYSTRKKQALIIDGKQQYPSLEYARMILDNYFYAYNYEYDCSGLRVRYPDMNTFYNKDNNSLTTHLGGIAPYEEGSAEDLQKLLSSLGFNPTIDGEGSYRSINIPSDVPYPVVKKSKYGQIYEKAKGKIKGMFEKLKSIVKPKENEEVRNKSDGR